MKQQLRNKAGFTLVELIVVIAILGILAGVGTVGYSGYVKQANKAKDIQLAGDVKYALQLAALDSSRDFGNGATVVLSRNEAPACSSIGGSADAIEAAMAAAFGPDWRGLRLSYEGWDSSNAGSVVVDYRGSTFQNNETKLLQDIQTLTSAMAGVFQNDAAAASVAGGDFADYLAEKGIDIRSNPQEAANYATLFVAEQVTNLTDENKAAINNAWNNNTFYYGNNANDVMNGVKMYADASTGLSTLGAMAVYYANLEAMVTYVNQQAAASPTASQDELDAFNQAFQNISVSFSGANNINDVWNTMANGYSGMLNATNDGSEIQGYITGYGNSTKNADNTNKDAKAFVSTMGAVNESAGTIGSDMTKDNLYGDGTVENLLKGYINAGEILGTTADGVAIIVTKQDGGKCSALAYPMDYVK